MTPHERYNQRLQWFKARIGKRVYRNSNGCDCPVCNATHRHGLVIEDDLQATYLRDCEADIGLHYADTRVAVWWWIIKNKLMKRLIYYSPYIPVVGLFTTLYFETCITDKRHYWYTLLVQSLVIGVLINSII